MNAIAMRLALCAAAIVIGALGLNSPLLLIDDLEGIDTVSRAAPMIAGWAGSATSYTRASFHAAR